MFSHPLPSHSSLRSLVRGRLSNSIMGRGNSIPGRNGSARLKEKCCQKEVTISYNDPNCSAYRSRDRLWRAKHAGHSRRRTNTKSSMPRTVVAWPRKVKLLRTPVPFRLKASLVEDRKAALDCSSAMASLRLFFPLAPRAGAAGVFAAALAAAWAVALTTALARFCVLAAALDFYLGTGPSQDTSPSNSADC